jgi:hypothetical protein
MSGAPRRPPPSSDDRKPTAADGVSITGRRRTSSSVEQAAAAGSEDARLETFEQGTVPQGEDAPDGSASSVANGTRDRTTAADEP